MKLSLALSLLTASSIALGAPGHAHNHEHKREVTVVMTKYLESNPVTGATTPAAAATSAVATSAASGAKSSTTILQPASSDSVASPSASSSGSTSSKSPSSGSGFYSGAKGISYSPYTKSGSCKSASVIKNDISLLSDFEVIRIYDIDCDSLEPILSSLGSAQKLFVGIHDIDNIGDAVSKISSAFKGDFSKVHTISVGNELVNFGTKTPSQIKSAVESARSKLSDIGYSGKVVSVDTLVAVEKNTDLCSCSDYIAVNSHAYWDGNVEPSNCGQWLKEQIENLSSACNNGKDILITETGWPNKGSSYGSCTPSQENQETCIKSIVETLGSKVFLFTTYNDYWKAAGSYGVEQNWGVFGDSDE